MPPSSTQVNSENVRSGVRTSPEPIRPSDINGWIAPSKAGRAASAAALVEDLVETKLGKARAR